MDLIDRLNKISERITKLSEQVLTEEATKNAFVMPFIQALGYDVFDPLEVVPEYVADIGIKKGEKVDYCILDESGSPCILIECKSINQKKMDVHKSQLHRYFHCTNARLGVLTNGNTYRFYSDLDKGNVMDDRPFLEFNLQNVSEANLLALKSFSKENFDIEQIIDSASGYKYTKEIKELLRRELSDPSEDFVKYFVQRIYKGRATSKVVESFTELVQKSTRNLINDLINQKLQKAIESSDQEDEEIDEVAEEVEDSGIETTEEELQAFRIVQAILMKDIDPDRIAYRDVKTYFGVLLDDNNRKPICRFHFNGSTNYIELFGENKSKRKETLDNLLNIYDFADELKHIVNIYDS